MKKSPVFLFLLLLALSSSCATFSTEESKTIEDSIKLALTVVGTDEFQSTLYSIEKDITWNDNDGWPGSKREKVDKLIEHLRSLDVDTVVSKTSAFYKWNPFSGTLAVTTIDGSCAPECDARIEINKWAYSDLENRLYDVANTMLHEASHWFCIRHKSNQTRGGNICDPAYIVGDLVQILALYNRTKRPVATSELLGGKELCSELKTVLENKGILVEE